MFRSSILRPLSFGLLLAAALPACSSTNQSRTNALQNRQNWMNERADAAAQRRQIRSDNMDARVNATFDAM